MLWISLLRLSWNFLLLAPRSFLLICMSLGLFFISLTSTVPPSQWYTGNSTIDLKPFLLHPIGLLLSLHDNTWLMCPSILLPLELQSWYIATLFQFPKIYPLSLSILALAFSFCALERTSLHICLKYSFSALFIESFSLVFNITSPHDISFSAWFRWYLSSTKYALGKYSSPFFVHAAPSPCRYIFSMPFSS